MAPTPDERQEDVDVVLGKRHDNGADYWSTPDGRIYVGSPFSTIGSLVILHELGVGAEHEAVEGGLDLVRAAVRDDGRIRLAPRAPLYPCYTAEAARVLCRYGLADEIAHTFAYFLDSVHDTGGWRCSFTRLGKGPETAFANPGATLNVLDVLRFREPLRAGHDEVDRAVESLLSHWETRAPLGPCHWGIGSLFMQVEFPFLRYNLFYFVYVLSFFAAARNDARFGEALEELTSRRDDEGRVVVQRPHRALEGLTFAAKGMPSATATERYREIVGNLAEPSA